MHILCDREFLTTDELNEKIKDVPQKDLEATFPLPVIRGSDKNTQQTENRVSTSQYRPFCKTLRM